MFDFTQIKTYWSTLQSRLTNPAGSSGIRRFFAWILLGALMVFSIFFVLFLLLLSWLLIPIMPWRGRRAMAQHRAGTSAKPDGTNGHIIEGELITRDTHNSQ